MEGPVPVLSIGDTIPALSKALGHVPPFPYGERPIPALFEVLEYGPPILALLKVLA